MAHVPTATGLSMEDASMKRTNSLFARRTRRPVPAYLLLIGALSLTLAGAAAAGHDIHPDPVAGGDLIDVQVRVDGRSTPLYTAPGRWDRRYFQAFRGRNYSLLVQNLTGERVGVLIAVDGLNVVNGERSRLTAGEAMYVLGPWEETEIRGWRTSLDEVRRFVFVDEERSYAERSGKANGDMGWVRVLAFRERVPPRLDRFEGPMGNDRSDIRNRQEGRDGRGRGAAEPPVDQKGKENESRLNAEGLRELEDSNPGTGWGRKSRDPVRRTTFTAEPAPVDHLVLRYEYASGLLALGIDIRPRRDRLRERELGDFGFARPPKW